MNLKLIPLLLVVVALFQSCRGPEGPQGPQGDVLVGTTFDLVDVDFNAGNEYQFGLTYARAGIDVHESDAVLVYIDWEDVNGSPAYRLLPQTAFLTTGILTYNFDRTNTDFSVFLDGSAPLATLPAEYTQNQRFRVIVVPSDFAPARTSGPLDYKDYNAVVKALGIDETKIRQVSTK